MPAEPFNEIPSATDTTLPLLKAIRDGGDIKLRDLVEQLAREFQLTEDQLAERVPSDTDYLFANRVAWGAMFLKRAALIAHRRKRGGRGLSFPARCNTRSRRRIT